MEYWPGFLTGWVRYGVETDAADPAWVGQLHNHGNVSFDTIDAFWADIAEAMTMTIRQSADALLNTNGTTRNYAVGVAYNTETCVIVQWPWLSLPAALIFQMIVFLVVTMVKSRHVVLWKESPLALLVYGLEQDLRDELHNSYKLKAVEKLAREMVVQLGDHHEQGVSFVDASGRRRNSV